jgi:hypothetical protein
MKGQLDLKFTFEKEAVHPGDAIFFIAHFTNKTDSPLTLRVPQQSDVLDIWAPKIALVYSIIPLDKSISLETPLSILNSTPYMFGDSLLPSEFEMLDSNSTKDVKLELPNVVYLRQGDKWIESELPPGQYWINLTYDNLYVGYQIMKPDQIYYRDISAWVGQIDAEPILLTIIE